MMRAGRTPPSFKSGCWDDQAPNPPPEPTIQRAVPVEERVRRNHQLGPIPARFPLLVKARPGPDRRTMSAIESAKAREVPVELTVLISAAISGKASRLSICHLAGSLQSRS